MKKVLPIFCSLLILAVGLFFFPTYGILDSRFASPAIAQAESTPHIGFSTGELFEDSTETIVTATEAAAFPTDSSAYRSSLHYNTLTESE